MSLTTDDLNAVVAQWEEWTADAGFALAIEVRAGKIGAMAAGRAPEARIAGQELYCQVQIRRGDSLVFDQSVPYDAALLKASVTVLARTIAQHQSL